MGSAPTPGKQSPGGVLPGSCRVLGTQKTWGRVCSTKGPERQPPPSLPPPAFCPTVLPPPLPAVTPLTVKPRAPFLPHTPHSWGLHQGVGQRLLGPSHAHVVLPGCARPRHTRVWARIWKAASQGASPGLGTRRRSPGGAGGATFSPAHLGEVPAAQWVPRVSSWRSRGARHPRGTCPQAGPSSPKPPTRGQTDGQMVGNPHMDSERGSRWWRTWMEVSPHPHAPSPCPHTPHAQQGGVGNYVGAGMGAGRKPLARPGAESHGGGPEPRGALAPLDCL